MITDPTDTIAYHGSRVLCQQRDMSLVPCSRVAQVMLHYKTALTDRVQPETEALWFYGLNHAIKLISDRRDKLEPLEKWELDVVQQYHALMGHKAVRAFYYLIYICIREARHCKTVLSSAVTAAAEVGEPAFDGWFSKTPGNGSENEISDQFMNKPPDMPFGAFCKAIAIVFYTGGSQSWSPNYGGKKWGAVTDCLVAFVNGTYSAEVMLDTVWTLVHNGGPIFNKGFAYNTQNTGVLKRLLDVQRSGQIPEAILHDAVIKPYAPAPLVKLMLQTSARYPSDIGAYVDWLLVEARGSVHKYPKDIQQQTAMHGVSPEQKAAMAAALLAKVKAEEEALKAAEKAKQEKLLHWFQVMPGLEVKKVYRAEAA